MTTKESFKMKHKLLTETIQKKSIAVVEAEKEVRSDDLFSVPSVFHLVSVKNIPQTTWVCTANESCGVVQDPSLESIAIVVVDDV